MTNNIPNKAQAAATQAVRSGLESDTQFGAVVPPLHLSSNFSFAGFDQKRQYDYTRSGNPTRDLLGETLAKLENGAGAVVTSSGMASITLALQLLQPGDLLVAPHDCYGGTYRLMTTLAAKQQFKLLLVDQTDKKALQEAVAQKPKMIWVETPSNPLLRITDIKAVVKHGEDCDALVVVDNTFLSPVLQKPIDLGADIVVHSTTKYLNGHSDVVGGAVVAATDDLHEKLAWWANCLGITGAPFDSFLTLRGIRTLHARLRLHVENVESVVAFLDGHDAVAKVFYPGLKSHPGHELAKQQQEGFGAMLSFELPDVPGAVQAFLDGLTCFSLAESLGGVESLVAHPATMTHAAMDPAARKVAGISDQLLRLSVGIEDQEDLLADLRAGLQRVEAVLLQRNGVPAKAGKLDGVPVVPYDSVPQAVGLAGSDFRTSGPDGMNSKSLVLTSVLLLGIACSVSAQDKKWATGWNAARLTDIDQAWFQAVLDSEEFKHYLAIPAGSVHLERIPHAKLSKFAMVESFIAELYDFENWKKVDWVASRYPDEFSGVAVLNYMASFGNGYVPSVQDGFRGYLDSRGLDAGVFAHVQDQRSYLPPPPPPNDSWTALMERKTGMSWDSLDDTHLTPLNSYLACAEVLASTNKSYMAQEWGRLSRFTNNLPIHRIAKRCLEELDDRQGSVKFSRMVDQARKIHQLYFCPGYFKTTPCGVLGEKKEVREFGLNCFAKRVSVRLYIWRMTGSSVRYGNHDAKAVNPVRKNEWRHVVKIEGSRGYLDKLQEVFDLLEAGEPGEVSLKYSTFLVFHGMWGRSFESELPSCNPLTDVPGTQLLVVKVLNENLEEARECIKRFTQDQRAAK